MKKIYKLFAVVTAIVLVITGCHKMEDLPYYKEGNAVSLSTNKTTVNPQLADTLAEVVKFSWTSPNYATDTNTYKYVLEIDSTGRNFSKKLMKTVYGNLQTGLTGRELNNILLNFGFALGSPYEIDVRVASSYTNNNEKYLSNVIKVTVTPFNDPSRLTTDKSTVACALATQNETANTFSWSKSFPQYTGTVNYVIQYDSAGKNFANPKQIAVGADILQKSLLQKELNETGLNCAIAGGATGKVDYRIKATTAQGAISYSNPVSITVTTYAVKLYLVGGSAPAGWTPSAASPMIADPNFPGTFFIYAKLVAGGGGIKFLTENTDWNTPTQTIFGDADNSGTTGNLTSVSGGHNIAVAADGIYRITVDLATAKYYLQTGPIGAIGLVGSVQPGPTWDPPTAIKMTNYGPNKFIHIMNMNQNVEFKFHDGNAWSNSSNSASRWYGIKPSTTTMSIDGPATGSTDNFKWTGTNGPVRTIFDYSNVTDPKYIIAPATEMRVVGNGIQGVPDWNPGASPQMTYNGNGEWTITLTLVAGKNIKFLAGNDWGAFDYEDASGGSTATGTPRAIRWDSGPDFQTPAVTGSYTITLNEYTQTVTIN